MTIGIGLLGCGTVGGGVVRLLAARAREIAERVGEPVEIVDVAVRDLAKTRVAELGNVRLHAKPESVVDNPDVDVVVELMGGLEPARTLVLAAIAKKKPVVTANKALLAHHGPEIFAAAREAGVDVAFEGSVGGGIPVVRTLRDALAGDAVKRLVAILNGTSNYVLTRMQREGLGFDEVVREAQRLGYAEADPSLDVDGHDAAHKLTVLSMLAFGARVDPSSIPTTGLRALEPVDHTSADRFGYVVKPLAVAEDVGPSLSLRVGPTLVRKDALLASVSGVLNAVLLEGNALGPCVLSGRGAGDGPTAVSVVSDLLDVARARRAKSEGLLTAAVRAEPRRVRDAGEAVSPYYLRFVVKDRPGVLGRITTALGGSGVSIREVVQQGRGSAEIPVDVVMLTHASSLASVTEALAVVDAEAFTVEPTRVLPVEEG
jgi:homoserine dehydrogenase